jgi:benzoyl-CoA reductase/2-hydroxyglutaryl-CoA dehydratase subunit BcrC/BadD/HgdB
LDIIDEIERNYGIPGIVIEADMIDPKFFSEAQIDIRLQALFEMIEARRKRKK